MLQSHTSYLLFQNTLLFFSFLQGHFLFFPSSNRTEVSQKALLLSPHLPPTKGTCLKFWVYKSQSCKKEKTYSIYVSFECIYL